MDLRETAKEINKIISEYQAKNELSFIEDTHTYFIKGSDGNITSDMPSVSTVLKCFYTPFNAEGTRAFKECGGDPVKEKELLDSWQATADYATNKGSRVHFILETDTISQYGSYKEVRKPIFECDEKQTTDGDQMIKAGKEFLDLMHSRGAVLLDTEIVLGNIEYGYFGQPDTTWLMIDKQGNIGLILTDWKGLPLDTPILTDNGWKSMGTLTKVDKVFDKDGNLVDIKNISKVKNKRCLKIKFDNEEIVSDYEHRWSVYTINNKKERVDRVMTTQEIKDHCDSTKGKRYPSNILRIDNAKPLNNCKKDLLIDPYLLGVWLVDGHKVDTKITQANEKVWEEIKKRGYNIGRDISQGGAGKATTRTVLGIRDRFSKLNLLNNKHVPAIYLMSSYEDRLDLLRGLMDADGTYNKSRKRFSVSTTKEEQVVFCTQIFASLGLKPSVVRYNKKFNGKIIKCANIEFSTTKFNPFLCRNQDLDLSNRKTRDSHRVIKYVEEVESVPTRCIEVDSPTSTFLCGHSFIVTHNTNKPKNFKKQPWTIKMLNPFQAYDDTALGHYYIQMPLYAKLLIKMLEGSKYENLKFLGGVVVLVKSDGVFEEYRIPKDIVSNVFSMNVKSYIDKLDYKK